MRVLQWQNSEFDTTVLSLVNVCTDLLHGKADIVEFVEAAASTLDWLVNHFFSLQDVSSIRATIKKQLEWEEESHRVSESEAGGQSCLWQIWAEIWTVEGHFSALIWKTSFGLVQEAFVADLKTILKEVVCRFGEQI